VFEEDRKFLVFELGEESYAIPILKVKEILGMVNITKVPRMPDYIRGVMNLRGKIIPVIDLRLKFGLTYREYDNRTCIIVVETKTEEKNVLSSIIVDNVNEVIDIDKNNIEHPPQCTNNIQQDFLRGMGKVNENVIMLLDVEKILSTD
jgi:purine-binding chemotaxis protein CheW